MIKSNLKTILISSLFVVLSAATYSFAQSGSAGEIINVNYQYKLAFTDLSRKDLNVGDYVVVKTDDSRSIYLQVIETTSVISKLGPIKRKDFNLDFTDISKVSIGDSVYLVSKDVNPSQEQEKLSNNKARNNNQAVIAEEGGLSSGNSSAPSNDAELSQRLTELTLENDVYIEEIKELKSTLSALRARLLKIESLLDESTP